MKLTVLPRGRSPELGAGPQFDRALRPSEDHDPVVFGSEESATGRWPRGVGIIVSILVSLGLWLLIGFATASLFR